MKEKQFDPAGSNVQSPSKGMASVDTANSNELDQKDVAANSPSKNDTEDQNSAESEGIMGE